MPQMLITTKGNGIKSKAIDYLKKKIDKLGRLMNKASNIECEIQSNKQYSKEVDQFKIEVALHLPHRYLRVAKQGEDIYHLIDEVQHVLKRQITKYKGKIESKRKKQRLAWEPLYLTQ